MGCGSSKTHENIISPMPPTDTTTVLSDKPSNNGCQISQNQNPSTITNSSAQDKNEDHGKTLQLAKKDENIMSNQKTTNTSTNLDMTVDLSKASMVDILNNAEMLIKAVILLIRADLARNQMLKVVLIRMEHLEPCISELQNKNPKLERNLIIEFIQIVNNIKILCEKIINDKKGLWDKYKDKSATISQLEELLNLNAVLAIAQKDLKIENSQKIDTMFQYLKEITEKGMKTYEGALNNKNILPLTKKFLTNEEAFVFWFECLPNKYVISIKKFQIIFKDYIARYKNVELKNDDMRNIMIMIKGIDDFKEENDDVVDAREVNAFFESLPIDFNWEKLNEIKKSVHSEQIKREAKGHQLKAQTIVILEEKIKKIENEETDEEKKLAKNRNYLRFFVKEAWIKKDKQKSNLSIRNVFLTPDNGEVIIYGANNKRGLKMSGYTDKFGQLKLELAYNNDEIYHVKGKFKIEETIISINGNCKAGRIYMVLDVEFWFGYYELFEEVNDMQTFLKKVGNNVVGISYDYLGLALWQGSISKTELHMIKSYVLQDDVRYNGKVKHRGAGTEIRGNWNIGKDRGEFYLAHWLTEHNDEDDSDSMTESDNEDLE